MKHAFKKIMALLLAVAMIVGILPAVLAADELPFTDVKENDWFAPYVDFVYNHEPQLMNGMTEDTFEPQGTLTRAMAAVVLYRLADPVIPSIKPSTFTDLTADWYKNGIAWAQQNGVVNGISEDKFDPEGLVTREQLVTMIWRYNDSPVVEKDYLKNVPDASKISDYAKEAFNWAISKKIISGSVNYDDSITLNPQGYATRAEFAKIIAVFADVTQGCEAGHSWDEGVITVEPTCTEPGEKVYTCVRCDETMTEEIHAMGHTYYDGTCYVCGEALAAEGDIVIYYTNDVHTYIDGALSYDTIADLKAQTKKIADGVLLVDAGDHIQGTAYGSMDKGETIIELMNAADYDLATLGNHEFDYGMERALELVGMAEFPYVSANFYHEKDGVAGDPVLDAYRMFEISGVKIALVGITTPESFTKSTPAYFQDENGNYIYGIGGGETGTAMYAYVQAAINAAKEEGADYIIALGHCGDDPASQPWTSEEVIANTVGLDAFIDGHSHSTVEGKEVTDKAGNPVLLTQTGEYFNAIGKMTITEDGISTELITDYTGSDSTVAAIQDDWIAEIETKLGEVIGYAEVTFDNYVDGNRIVRKQETNTGDFAADALYYLFDNMGLDVDVAIMNGGGVRNKAITGEISYLTCKNIHTFGNVACLQTITGQQLLDALEWGARGTPDEEIGGFLHVSGVTYEIHTDIASTVQQDEKGVWVGGPTGEYRVKNVMVGGEPLDLDAKYNLAGYNYTLRDLGDGFAMFDGAVNVLDYVMEDYQVLANYVKSFAPDAEHNNLPTIQSDSIYAEVTGEGRITLVSDGGSDTPDEPDDPDTPDDPNPPATGDSYVLTNELKAGDEVIIVCAAKNMALSSTYNGFYNAAVAVEPVNGVITNPAADIVWTVGKNGDNYTFSFDGKNLGMADSYSSMPLGEKNDQWTISAGGTANTWFVFNVGRQVYIEYYETNGNWSGYYNNSVAELFELSFYVKGGTGGETPDEPDTPDTPDNPNPPATGDDYVLTNELKAGDQVVIVCAAKNMALSSTYNGFYNAAVAVEPVDGVLTNPAAELVWTVGKNGDNYTFSFDGKNLGMADSYSSMPLGEKNDQWTISAG
ncbi:MAG: 5'-nucleotidase C-terminal domain-containing protein, partial [Oscillospiraceae bacterium]|nr:5'-nucleotidase C-terminal domain-containing protein [Oscillospiraceae bacterium]